ncbi:MAG TPA: helix-turn-helix domain-containing protein [Capillimicrobium sp.]
MVDALDIVGDRYTLPIVREITYGYRRFNEIAAYTGAPRNLLTGRLRRLEEAGVLERRQYSERPARYEYRLTEAGRDLLPIVQGLKEWGERHGGRDEPIVVFEHSCGAEFHPVTVCAACREPVDPGSLEIVGGSNPPVPKPAAGAA